MRYRVTDYAISATANQLVVRFKSLPDGVELTTVSGSNELDAASTRKLTQAIRLIVDETAKEVFCSSMQKDRIVKCYGASSYQGINTVAAIEFAVPDGKSVSSGDMFTIEWDWGEALDSADDKVFKEKTFAQYAEGDPNLAIATFYGSSYHYYGLADGKTTTDSNYQDYFIVHTYKRDHQGNVEYLDRYDAIKASSGGGNIDWGEGNEVYRYDQDTDTIGSLVGTVTGREDVSMPKGYATETNATANKRDIKGADSTKVFDCGASIPACSFDDGNSYDINLDSDKYWLGGTSECEIPEAGLAVGSVLRATEVDAEEGYLLCTSFTNPTLWLTAGNVKKSGDDYYLDTSGGATFVAVEANKNYRCKEVVELKYIKITLPVQTITGYLYIWEEYEGCSIHDAKEEISDKLGDVEDALEYIQGGGLPTITAIAKQGSDASATLTATQAAVVDGNDTAISAIKDVRSEVGTSSDTAAESGTTLFAVLKWVKDKVKSIFNLIGSPASGQPSTLFAAIAAGGGGGGGATPAEAVDDSVSSKALDPNKLYIFTNRTSNLTITLNAGEAGVANEYHFFIEVGSSLPTITFPNTITWVNTLTMSVNSNVEISILNDYAVWM